MIIERVLQVSRAHPSYGYRRIGAYLKSQGVECSYRHVRRCMRFLLIKGRSGHPIG